MKITFLGTGTSMGVPVIACPCAVCHSTDAHDKRLRTSALIETDDGKNFLIDIGPDFRGQMLSLDVTHLDAIFITHAHRDHVGGIDDIRSLNYVQNKAMEVYANAPAIKSLKHDYAYIFEPHAYPGLPEVNLHELTGDEVMEIEGYRIVPIKALHKDLPVLGYRVGDLAYITDASYIDTKEVEKLKDVNVLVINALRKTEHFSHFSLPEALEVIKAVGPNQAYITHISHEMGFHKNVDLELPKNVHLAYDGLTVEIE